MAGHRILRGIPLPRPACQSFKQGHNVHWMQARNNTKRPRYLASVELIDSTTLVVSWLEESATFHNHCVAGISQALDSNVDGFIEYNPQGKLLYIRARSTDSRIDEFYVAYLATEEVSECSYLSGGRP